MDGLLSLIRVLRPSEKRLIRHYYSRTTNAEEKLRLKLFDLVCGGTVKTDSEAKEGLVHKGSLSAYSHLKSRLKDDILNVLLLQGSEKRIVESNRAAALECRKKVAQAYLLLLRGATIEGMKVFRKAMHIATRYELLSERLQLNHLQREKLIGTNASARIVKLNKDISDDMATYEALLRVEELSILLSAPDFFKKARRKGGKDERQVMVEQLGTYFRQFKLARIGFWYYLASTEYHTAVKEYAIVVTEGSKFLKLVEKSPAVWSKNNLAGINLTMGMAYLELLDFDNAIKTLSESEKLFPATTGFNRLRAMQHLFQAYVASGRMELAMKVVLTALAHPRIDARPQLKPLWLFFKACVEFRCGDVSTSFRTLNSNVYLLKQRDEWNVQFRLLELFQMVEMKDEEWMEFKIQTLRKFLARNKKLDTPRVRSAIEVLSNLLRKGLVFADLSDKSVAALKACENGDSDYEWSPTGSEIIRFDLWMKQKME